MNKVSVIVPIYNPGKKLNKCIKSITNQTFKEFELILVNDGSTDNSLTICNKYAEKDNRLKVINKKNEGSIKARRTGIENSNGDFIMFVDADDWIDIDTIRSLYEESIKCNCDIVVGNMYKVLGDRAIIKQKNNSHYFEKEKLFIGDDIKNKLVEAYLYGHPFPAGLVCKLYKRELLINSGKYLDRINFLGDDLFFNLEIFLKAKRVKILSEPLYYYRIGGFTSKYMPYHFDDIVNGYEIQKEVIERYYQNTKNREYKGISIMLLNSFKTSLQNLMMSEFEKKSKLEYIDKYIRNKSILEAVENEGSRKYFEEEYLRAIKLGDTDYLYNLGLDLYNKSKGKRIIKKLLTSLNIV